MTEVAVSADQDAPCRLAESDDRYPAVAVLNQRHRVIRCRAGIQWILQRRNVPAGTGGNRPEGHSTSDWRGRSYCRTREALIRCCHEHAGEIAPSAVAALEALPERIEVTPQRAVSIRKKLAPDLGSNEPGRKLWRPRVWGPALSPVEFRCATLGSRPHEQTAVFGPDQPSHGGSQ